MTLFLLAWGTLQIINLMILIVTLMVAYTIKVLCSNYKRQYNYSCYNYSHYKSYNNSYINYNYYNYNYYDYGYYDGNYDGNYDGYWLL